LDLLWEAAEGRPVTWTPRGEEKALLFELSREERQCLVGVLSTVLWIESPLSDETLEQARDLLGRLGGVPADDFADLAAPVRAPLPAVKFRPADESPSEPANEIPIPMIPTQLLSGQERRCPTEHNVVAWRDDLARAVPGPESLPRPKP
jgi:hypothetical protein